VAAPVVLVVDDNAAFRGVLALLLVGAGYGVREAGDGREGLEQLRRHPRPNVVLLDLAMPVLDGAGFRAAQRQDPAVAGVPVVVISAHGAPGDAERLAATACLEKPVDLDDVLRLVRSLCTQENAVEN
jgi:CheY-like chemotaxis protein